MKLFSIFLFLTFFSITVNARADDDYAVLKQFAASLHERNYTQAKELVSSGSKDLFDRYSKYDLGANTPANIKMINQSSNGQYRYLKVANADQGTNSGKGLKVAFITENNMSKIDLPESLRLGFGADWQQRVNMIEQSYVFAKQNLGDQQSMQILNTLLKKQ